MRTSSYLCDGLRGTQGVVRPALGVARPASSSSHRVCWSWVRRQGNLPHSHGPTWTDAELLISLSSSYSNAPHGSEQPRPRVCGR